MSYEGFTQYLCKNGHYHTQDCNFSSLNICPDCKEPIVWQNMVDETNGSFEERDGKIFRIDGYVDLVPDQKKICKCCKTCLEITYKIPKN